MAGGDIDVLFTADDKEVSEGLSRLKLKAGGTAAEIEKMNQKLTEGFTGFKNVGPAAIGAVSAAWGMGLKAASDYADKNSYIHGQFDALQRAGSRTWTAIGRDITSGGIGPAVEFLNWLEKIRVGGVEALSSAFRSIGSTLTGGDIMESVMDEQIIDDAMKATEAMDRAAKDRLTIEREITRLAIESAHAKGQNDAAAKMEIEARRKEELRALGASGIAGGRDRDLMEFAINDKAKWATKAVDDEARARERAERDNKAREDEAVRRKQQAADKSKEDAYYAAKRAELDVQAAEAEAKRGKVKASVIEAELEEIELAKRLIDVKQNDALNNVQKLDLINRLEAVSGNKISGILNNGGKDPRDFTLASSINATGAAMAAAKGGAGLTVAMQTRDASVRTARAVEKLAANGVAAVLG